MEERKQQLKSYVELRLPLQGMDSDALSGVLFRHGCLGIQEISEKEWIVYFPGNWSPEHLQQLFAALHQFHPQFNKEQVHIETIPHRDWNAEWRKFFKPIEATEGVWVRPPWEELPANARGLEIIIDPQMAFGTGHHETTRLMMQAMQKSTVKNASVLDLGTGSGILAILAEKMGASGVVGVDIDPEAIDNAQHNRALNRADKIEFLVGDISAVEDRLFSLVLANIHFDVLLNLALPIYHILQDEGRLILSGILQTDVNRLSYIYKHAGLVVEERFTLNEWAALVLEKM